ncbi:acyl-CoA dehydrogenase family protein [Bosea sp. RCC_152_1]|uniref:acyl-CoA dehydrogenase family protein n=1 Tax=Bosea sp. RCC_152_1 TaxID=3239228 RepID=UPI0035249C0A
MSGRGSLAAVQAPPRTSESSREELLGRVPALAQRLAAGASEREQRRELPHEGFRLVREAGLGALRIPRRLGGPGGTISDLVAVLEALAAADPNVAHALRSHFNFTETQILGEETPRSRELIDRVLGGALFAGASTEVGTVKPGQITTRLRRDGDAFRLSGRKFYATGTAFADYAVFSAHDDGDRPVSVLVPTDRDGITIHDDWDGMGQRLTASGSVQLDEVVVFPHEVTQRQLGADVNRHTSSLRQLHLVSCAAGIVRNIVTDAATYVQRDARAVLHSSAETGRQDPFVQQVLGELSAASFVIDAAIAAAAAALDHSAEGFWTHAGDLDERLLAGSLAVSRTQIAVYPQALKAAETLFEIGGGSTTASRYNFDRHWRNIRTLSTHNPLRQKARAIGDYLANDETELLRAGRVF